jgi:hypothetical protein
MITTRIAFLVVVDDYHDIAMIANAIKGVELSWREVGVSEKDYVGVIYDGCSPGDGEVMDLLIAADLTITN